MDAPMPAPRGLFVSFEGGDGSGKTTQLRLLAQRLRDAGRDVVATREPGGAPGAEDVRRLLLEGAPGRWSPGAELLLFNAARRDHVERVIAPALAQGAIVLCDRFADSTRVYQGAARDCAPDAVDLGDGRTVPPPPSRAMADALHALVIGIEPDLTLIFDLDPEVALVRGAARGDHEQRFERLGLDFHKAVRGRFRALASQYPARCRLVNADGAPEEVAERVVSVLSRHLPGAAP
jgi:dTMP kinase